MSTLSQPLSLVVAELRARGVVAAPERARDRELGAGGQLLDGVAAVVDEGGLEERARGAARSRDARICSGSKPSNRPSNGARLPPVSVIEQQVLDQLILREIQLQRAARVNITVNDDLLNEALSRVAQGLGLPIEELPAVLAAQNIDYAAYRDDSRRDLLIEQLEQRDVVQRIAVTPRELEQCLVTSTAAASDAYDYNVSHILIGVPANASQQDIETQRAHQRAARQARGRRRFRAPRRRKHASADGASKAAASAGARRAAADAVRGPRHPHEAGRLLGADPEHGRLPDRAVERHARRGAHHGVDQLHVRHILLRPNEILDDSATMQKILGIRAQIVGGDDFATVAEAVSVDNASAAEGGDLGWVSPGDTVPEFEQALAELPLNELSQPIKSRFGWHIVEVLERRSRDTTDEVKRENCARQVRAAKREEERELWARRLRDQAFVDIRK